MSEGIETRIILSKEITSFLTSVMNNANCSRSLKTKVRIALMDDDADSKKNNKEKSISYDVLKEAHDFYTEFLYQPKQKCVDLHTIVKSSKVFNEPVPKPVRSSELLQRLDKLQAQQEQRQYDEMTKNISTKRMTLGQEIGTAMRTNNQQFMTIINFLLSIIATFAFGYVASQFAFSDDFGLRLIFSICLATVVALAELYFMARVEI